MKNLKNPPAFPCPAVVAGGMVEFQGNDGMTLRDYFAAKALQGILSVLGFGIKPEDVSVMCADCYMIADAMIAARQQS